MLVTSAALFIAISLVVFGISYYYFTTRHRERMALLEKGLPPNFFKDGHNYLHIILLLGIVSIGISIGIGAGVALRSVAEALGGLALPLMVFFCLGISLVIAYVVLMRIRK